MPLDMTCKPWYKDKLPSKCFTKHKKMLPKFPTPLDSRRWIFVEELLDDFRKGCPPCEDMITRSPKEGFLPGIAHRVPQHAPKRRQKKLPEEADPFSTLSPAQLAQKAFVENIEAHLTKHPLALYPHLEEDLPADLLLKVLEVLDPDGKLEDTRAYCQGPRKRTKSPTELRKKRPAKVYLEPPKKAPGSHPASLHHEDKKSSRKDSLTDPPVHREVPKAIRKSFKWVAAFGSLGTDEELITKPCEVGCEWPPAQDTVYMKKVTQVPSKAKLWEKLVNDEPSTDPNVLLEDGSFRKKLPEHDILEDPYGTIALKDFILRKGYRIPDILERLFLRKGWKYDSVKTPIHKVIKISQNGDDAREDV
ncbi:protein FAM47E-like [Physeter macrocephalus]|uniref:Protein FAM47E-like n=1 Tax=Physeter macrocephalus TaxID=9755 RepID=A0A9W2WFP7_PHYMC|nr:protein FAM47E-like [Physeter catodon]